MTAFTERKQFAKHVHAQAHAIVALNEVRRAAQKCRSIDVLIGTINRMVATRAQSIGIEPDLLSDAIEDAAQELSIERAILMEEGAGHA